MQSSSSSSCHPRARQAARGSADTQLISRADVRRIVHAIVRRAHLRSLAARQRPALLTESQCATVRCQSNMIESFLYRRAPSLEEYRDPSDLVERVYRAGRSVYTQARQREMEREVERRFATVERRFAAATARSRKSRESLLAIMQVGSDGPGGGKTARRQRSASI